MCKLGLRLCAGLLALSKHVIFQGSYSNTYLQVIFREIYWPRFWSQLPEEETIKSMKNKCQRLEGVVMELFKSCGWNFRRRIDT
ncbi:hypothetical protein GQ55_8G233000 [Panicum hallii var. hallii]|uniref:Uncharacterized protein n=1 Tax=Panicum hallii var. hallii TaxID=1504633 RepID=A0A2T7CQD9_9POAL|nr:hypothetical protein GQ55_8G233000 [Panicum hallii var. hallii]